MIEVDRDIYSRSDGIGLRIPNSVCIIGVGGVGGWVAFKFPLIGINNIILIDPDTLEESNLNRLPYKYDQIGMHKVHAMQELIRERRMCNVQAFPMRWEEIPDDVRAKWLAPSGAESSIIIDCRDSTSPLKGITDTTQRLYVTGGYDGSSVTMHKFPTFGSIWGEDEVRYRTTPSYLVPPDLIATLIVNFICYEIHHTPELLCEEAITFDVRNLWNIIKRGAEVLEREAPTVPASAPDPEEGSAG